jgi:hypothetical protein
MTILLMAIDGYSINCYWCLLLVIILMIFNGYYISGYYIGGYWWLFKVILLMVIGGYSINGY